MAKKKRSNFERTIARSLTGRGVTYAYEPLSLSYHKKVYRPECLECGSSSVISVRSYTPDFYLPDYDIYIEAKGKLNQTERTKLIAVKEANPDIDLRLVFMQNNKLSRNSKTRYTDWAHAHGFLYATGDVPDEWIV